MTRSAQVARDLAAARTVACRAADLPALQSRGSICGRQHPCADAVKASGRSRWRQARHCGDRRHRLGHRFAQGPTSGARPPRLPAIRPGRPAIRRRQRHNTRWRAHHRRPRARNRGSCHMTRPHGSGPGAPRSSPRRPTLHVGCRGRRCGGRGRRSWCAARPRDGLPRSLHGIRMLLNNKSCSKQGERLRQEASPICDCSQFCSPTCATSSICVSRWSMCCSVSSRISSSSSRDT